MARLSRTELVWEAIVSEATQSGDVDVARSGEASRAVCGLLLV